MANRPLLYNHIAFDSNSEEIFKFSWSGNQSFKNRLKIYNGKTNQLVYDEIQTTFHLYHVVSPRKLLNGIIYHAELSVFDNENNESISSEKITFICLTSPSFQFSNVIKNQVIKNSSFTPLLSYTQIENEELQSFKIELCDTLHNIIHSSGVKYDTTNLSATIPNLEDNTQYFLRATGETVNGFALDTGYIAITVDYVLPALYAVISLENIRKEGCIKIESRMVQIVGRYEPENEDPTYIDKEKIDLTKDNVRVIFDKGFSFSKDYTLGFKGCSYKTNKVLATWTNGTYTATLSTRKGHYEENNNQEKAYVDLYISCELGNYYIMSNFFNVPPKDKYITIWVRRINNIYQVCVVDK